MAAGFLPGTGAFSHRAERELRGARGTQQGNESLNQLCMHSLHGEQENLLGLLWLAWIYPSSHCFAIGLSEHDCPHRDIPSPSFPLSPLSSHLSRLAFFSSIPLSMLIIDVSLDFRSVSAD